MSGLDTSRSSATLPFEHFYREVRIIGSGRHRIERLVVGQEIGACWGRFVGASRDGKPLDERFADVYELARRAGRAPHGYFFRSAIWHGSGVLPRAAWRELRGRALRVGSRKDAEQRLADRLDLPVDAILVESGELARHAHHAAGIDDEVGA